LLAAALAAHPSADQSSSSSTDRVVQTPADRFSGAWEYNADESVNAATGRPERPPRIAGVRDLRPATYAPPTPAPAGALAGATFVPPTTGPTQLVPTVAMIPENRSLVRDLLEIPEVLNIAVTTSDVTFVDDLERRRTYVTDGSRRHYQLGAAQFNATTEWNGQALEKYIDAPNGFRMTETYFLSPDASRMFVIVRVTSTRKDAPVMGVNRVYDRVVP